MRSVRLTRLGMFSVLLAALFGFVPATAAQTPVSELRPSEAIPAALQEATEAGLRGIVASDEEPGRPYAFSLVVVEFDTKEQAEAAFDGLAAAFDRFIGGDAADATPMPSAPSTLVKEYDLADGGAAYRYEETDRRIGAVVLGYVVIRDSSNLHFWYGANIVLDEPVEPVQLIEPLHILDPLVEEWFADGSRAEDDILDRLPNVDDLPEGYEVGIEVVGLDALRML